MGLAKTINRRSFLRLCGLQMAGLAMPVLANPGKPFLDTYTFAPAAPLSLQAAALPARLQSILSKIPPAWIDRQGLLRVGDAQAQAENQAPLTPTLYNQEHSRRWFRLTTRVPWAIVLHWYGDKTTYDRTVAGYLRGFDSLRNIDGEDVRTSAHFLVGSAPAGDPAALSGVEIGFLQTQAPAEDGVPYIGAHVAGLDYEGYAHGEHYFVKALDKLYYQDQRNRHVLQEMYQGPQIDPNRRTIGIEIAGHHFDHENFTPDEQQIANVIGLVRALMIRYRLPAKNIVGHYELSLGKPDPGKNFLALIRYLLGVTALADADPEFKQLVFGQYLTPGESPEFAVRRYFKFVRDYLVLTTTPARVYRWEGDSHFWLFSDLLPGAPRNLPATSAYISPLIGQSSLAGGLYLRPESHEGIDLYQPADRLSRARQQVRLVADGQCLYAGKSRGEHGGQRAIFRHRQPDGAEFLTVYAHMMDLPDLQTGRLYPAAFPLGHTDASSHGHNPFLHFALGYGSAWESALNSHPEIPLNAGFSWVRQHFMDPLQYDFKRFELPVIAPFRSVLYD